jgi:signal transduction histidine kinase
MPIMRATPPASPSDSACRTRSRPVLLRNALDNLRSSGRVTLQQPVSRSGGTSIVNYSLGARLNLWPRLVLMLTIGFVTLFGVFSLVSLRALDESTRRILLERQVIAQIAAQRYDELLTQAYDELDNATTFATFDPAQPDLSNEAHLLAHVYGPPSSFSLGVVFLDAHGRAVLAEPGDGRSRGADYSAFPFIAQVMQTGQRTISNPFRDPHSGKPAVAVTIPIFDRTGGLLSLLSGWIDLTGPTMLSAIEQVPKLGATGHAVLMDEHAIMIASTERPADVLKPGEHLSFYLRMLAERRVGVESVPVEVAGEAVGQPMNAGQHVVRMHVMAFAPLTVTPWGVAVGGSEDETFAPVRGLRRDIFLGGAASFAVIFVATLWGAGLLVRPVKVLTAAAAKIAEGDLSHPIRVREGGEIGALAESFEAMRAHLQRSHAEITAWGSELEVRVEERTQELESLNAKLRRQESDRQQLLASVINAQEAERKRVARELHDETAQSLTALLMSLESVEAHLPEASASLRASLQRSITVTQDALRELRGIIVDLRPAALDDLGLIPAIRRFAEEHLEPLGIAITIDTRAWPRARVPSPVETVLFRVLQEAINNVARHAQAHHVRLILEATGEALIGRVEDDGQGFDPQRQHVSWGLLGMSERANLVGGRVEVQSAPGRGTSIAIHIPRERQDSHDEYDSDLAGG